ncbi:MAG: carbohydrate ABC transporter substrate-binding protein [Lachnospiraceae bacterium]|nr:carbohydrate ABC transporter substrate-binding protein [Lachnospiraceae bacterium]
MKSIVALVLVLAMSLTMWGCGGSSSSSTATSSKKSDSSAATSSGSDEAPAAEINATDDGTVLNIYCWNTEFQGRFKAYYPGYTPDGEGDEASGKISNDLGEFTVNWVITPSDDNAYQNKLDETLPGNTDASADDKIDIFLIEADYALKYVNSDYTVDVKGLGLTDDDLSQMYDYTKTVGTNNNDGTLRAVSWQATPGLFAYRRSIAKDVLGTDDPTEVQSKLSDWSAFDSVAAQAKEKGYFMLSGYDDAYRTFSNNVSKKWVDDSNTIQIDDALWQWVDQTKTYTDSGYNNKTSLWSPEWSADQSKAGKVFGFFYSTWGINFTLLGNSLEDAEGEEKVGNGIYGDWAVCEGPAAYYWGGSWICAAAGTDNKSLVCDIMRVMTCDQAIAKKITEDTQDYTNNMAAMEEIANSDYSSDFLGGQNHIALFAAAAPNIDISNMGAYDQGLNESFQGKMKDYFTGESSKEDAEKAFYTEAKEKYPDLNSPS